MVNGHGHQPAPQGAQPARPAAQNPPPAGPQQPAGGGNSRVRWVILGFSVIAVLLGLLALFGPSDETPPSASNAPTAIGETVAPAAIPQRVTPQAVPEPAQAIAPATEATREVSAEPAGPLANLNRIIDGMDTWDGLGLFVAILIILAGLWGLRFVTQHVFSPLFGAVGGIRIANLVGLAAFVAVLALGFGMFTDPRTTATKLIEAQPVRNALIDLVVGDGTPEESSTTTAVQQTGVAGGCPLFQSAGASCTFGSEGSGRIGVANDVPAGSHLCWTPGPGAFQKIEYLSGTTGRWELFNPNSEPSNVLAYRFFPKGTVELDYNAAPRCRA